MEVILSVKNDEINNAMNKTYRERCTGPLAEIFFKTLEIMFVVPI
jgi:hypothetical protein